MARAGSPKFVGAPPATTIKRLFALSGDRCAFPGGMDPLLDQKGISSPTCATSPVASPAQGDTIPSQTEKQRHGFNNTIVLCANHHRLIDSDETNYKRRVFLEMKRVHKGSATEKFITNKTGRNNSVTGAAITVRDRMYQVR